MANGERVEAPLMVIEATMEEAKEAEDMAVVDLLEASEEAIEAKEAE